MLATNETHPVREFVEKAFKHAGITVKWLGQPGTVDETGVDAADESRVLVRVDPKYFRPTEVDILIGNPAKVHSIKLIFLYKYTMMLEQKENSQCSMLFLTAS